MSTNKPTNNPSDIPVEQETNNALKEATKIIQDMKKKELEEDSETTVHFIFKTITGDMITFCGTLLMVVLIYYFYKGYGKKSSMYGGGINNYNVGIMSEYTYE
jgi:hypothetical protein